MNDISDRPQWGDGFYYCDEHGNPVLKQHGVIDGPGAWNPDDETWHIMDEFGYETRVRKIEPPDKQRPHRKWVEVKGQ